MTRTLDAAEDLGAVVSATLEALGLGLKTLAYADWLHEWKLRQHHPGRETVLFTRMPALPADLQAAVDRDRERRV